MALTKRWAGKAWGTNIGNVFVTLEGEDSALTGTLRMNEQGVGIAVYSVQGAFEAPTLTLTGQPQVEIEDVEFGELTVTGTMNAKGEIHGDWQTIIGSAGTFVLFPHAGGEQADDIQRAEQFHIARHNFGAIEIDREQITEIAESIRRDFPSVIVTVVAGTEQARYLEDFKQLQFSVDKAEIIKIFASKPDGTGSNQVVSIEFGPQVNSAMTQGANEAWVLGQLETLKRDLKRYERTYITNFKRWGIGINQLMLLGAVVFLPSLSGLGDRAILMGAVLALIVAVNWLHSRYVPFAAIYLREKKKGLLGGIWPSMASWVIGIVAAVIATLLAAYLQGWLQIPAPPSQPPAVSTSTAK
ncbi:hypothetical protein [Sphingomonas cavernae]|uniref:Uncharacterized protein n=1 Tax=Sphingomonas cavernae TaxID=2320861 RepID=A0A418W6W4_9SPHN|nr:hypothetical protein [Sphingomonas cavernae]RJF85697.1 hypothetical protein D3876_17535 [Sphingomonas cavernae]